jgi:dephospho-CoA kinase
VKEEVTKEIFEAEKNNTELFILESALLIEDDYEKFCDEIWYVHVDVDARKNRLIYARGYSEEKVEAIMAAQLEKKEYMRNCDRVIDNTGVFDEATMQIDNIMKDL